MKPGQHFTRGDLQAGLSATVLIHVLVALAVGMMMISEAIDEEDDLVEEEPSVEVVMEEDPWEEPEWLSPPDLMEEFEEAPLEMVEEEAHEEDEPQEEEEEVAEEEESPPDDQELDRYAVEQVTDGEEPEEADHISDEAHTAEEETVAEITTLEDALPEEELEAQEIDQQAELELAMQIPMEDFQEPEIVEIEEEEVDDEEELIEDEWEEPEEEEFAEEESLEEEYDYRDPNEMFVISKDSREFEFESEMELEQLFRQHPDKAREILGEISEERARQERQTGRPGQGLLSRWEENDEAFRASLENFLPHVQPGNHTSVNARAAAHASYINRMHRSIHPRWAGDFIGRASRNFSMRDPINDLSLVVVVEIVINAEDGEIVEVGRARPSGHELYDAEAMSVARSIGPQPNPPDSIVSPDGKVYIHWTFWRDMRQCGTFGVRILQLQEESDRRAVD